MRYKKSTTLFCFSPPVMLATFVIEALLLGWVIARYGLKTARTRLIAVTLFCLAIFQLAEYNVCGGLGLQAELWSRVGFVAITLLPAFGLHLVFTIAGRSGGYWRALTGAAYAMAAVWIYIFGFTNHAFYNYVCGGNYIIFNLKHPYDSFYLLFYGLWLAVAIGLAVYFMRTAGRIRRQALQWMVTGYLLFIVPTLTVMTLKPETTGALPSIMCGFAVLYAIALTFGVARLESRITRDKRKK